MFLCVRMWYVPNVSFRIAGFRCVFIYVLDWKIIGEIGVVSSVTFKGEISRSCIMDFVDVDSV